MYVHVSVKCSTLNAQHPYHQCLFCETNQAMQDHQENPVLHTAPLSRSALRVTKPFNTSVASVDDLPETKCIPRIEKNWLLTPQYAQAGFMI